MLVVTKKEPAITEWDIEADGTVVGSAKVETLTGGKMRLTVTVASASLGTMVFNSREELSAVLQAVGGDMASP